MEEHGGTILNIVSGGAFGVVPMVGWYRATKAALVHLTKQLASELAPNVRVNAVSPGNYPLEVGLSAEGALCPWSADEAGA